MTFMGGVIADPSALGAALREVRTAHGWTQAELAERAGVSRRLVIELERGARPRTELVRVFAVLRALGKSIQLVDDEPSTFDDVLSEVLG